MNIASVVVVVLVLGLVGGALWSAFRKGVPGVCGGKCKGCPGCSHN